MRTRATPSSPWIATAVLAVIGAFGQGRPAAAQDPVARTLGSIEGIVSTGSRAQRRWASRYPGAADSSGELQRVPPVVYLEGPVGGVDPNGRVVDIGQRDRMFTPSALAVTTGTVLRFPNADPFFHNVYSYSSNARFDLGRYPEGESREVLLSEPGIVRIYCEIHEFMRAVVVVTDHGFQAVVEPDGTFRIDGVPAGEYTFRAYHPDLGTRTERVVVSSGRVTNVRMALGG